MKRIPVAAAALAGALLPAGGAFAAQLIPTAQEQLMLELINRARLDPAGEAARYGISLNEGPPSTPITSTPKPPLAMNYFLVAAARNHSVDMLARNYFAHNTPEGVTPQTRANNEGYVGSIGENISWRGESPGPIQPTPAIFLQHQSLFVDSCCAGRGHRLNILNADYREVGIGQAIGTYQGFSTSMITQDFGIPNPAQRFITGVAFDDGVTNDDFYTVGEARPNVRVTSGNFVDTNAAGGYSLPVTTAAQTVRFSGGGLPAEIVVVMQAGTTNLKLDVVDGNTIYSSANIRHSRGARGITLLGVARLTATGASAAEILTGNRGANTLDARGGNDTLIGGLGPDILIGGTENDTFKYLNINETRVGAGLRDIIEDFVRGQDKIDLATIDASTRISGNNAFLWRGTGAITTSTSGELRYQRFDNAGTTNDYTIVYGDTDADTAVEFEIELKGLIALSAANFTL